MPVLSDAKVRALKPKGRPYKQADFDGFFVLVNPNGSKLWRFTYRWMGKEKRLEGKSTSTLAKTEWRTRSSAPTWEAIQSVT